MPSAHDASYKLLFSAPELVRDLVLGFIPDAWRHSLDYATLEKMPGSYISDDMRRGGLVIPTRVGRACAAASPSFRGACLIAFHAVMPAPHVAQRPATGLTPPAG